jgi:hypothetical protein
MEGHWKCIIKSPYLVVGVLIISLGTHIQDLDVELGNIDFL